MALQLIYSEEQEAYRDALRRFMDKVLRPIHREIDQGRPLTRADVDRIYEQVRRHEIATTMPLREDGTLDHVALSIFTEELWTIDASLGNLAIGGVLFSPPKISVPLTSEQETVFGHLFQPGKFVALGLTEANVGSNPSAVETTARRSGDGWVLQGRKMWITNGDISDGIVIVARMPDDDDQIGMFLLDRAIHPYETRPIPCLGLAIMPPSEVLLDEIHVAPISRLSSSSGVRSAIEMIEDARVLVAAGCVGMARASLELATDYALDRKQFGRPIAAYQLVQEMLAEMATDVELGRLLTYRAVSLREAGIPARKEISMAKYWCTEMAQRVTSKGIQVHGAMGLSREVAAERYFRDARIFSIPDGTTQIHKLVIGRDLTGISAIGNGD